ncbi:hypothetical protein [Streptomyces sp. NRRL F-5630]
MSFDRSVSICAACAIDEAVRDQRGMPPVPPADWPVAELRDWSSRA